MTNAKRLYLIGLGSWVAYVVLFPTWIGRLYNTDVDGDGQSQPTGVFGLQDESFTTIAPLWDPPGPHSDPMGTAVRWPGQTVTQSAHVELALGSIAARLSLGVLLGGLVLGGWAPWIARTQRDRLVSFTWHLSLALVIAWVCVLAVGAFTAGYGLVDEAIIGILALGGLGGCVYALFASRRRPSNVASTPPARSSPRSPPAGGPSPVVPLPGRSPAKAGTGLLWFTVGIVSALCLTFAGGWIALFFRGPILGVSELGTTRYANDQAPVNIVTGLAILAAGWTIGLLVLRVGPSRGLSVGLILGATLLGIIFALQ